MSNTVKNIAQAVVASLLVAVLIGTTALYDEVKANTNQNKIDMRINEIVLQMRTDLEVTKNNTEWIKAQFEHWRDRKNE